MVLAFNLVSGLALGCGVSLVLFLVWMEGVAARNLGRRRGDGASAREAKPHWAEAFAITAIAGVATAVLTLVLAGVLRIELGTSLAASSITAVLLVLWAKRGTLARAMRRRRGPDEGA